MVNKEEYPLLTIEEAVKKGEGKASLRGWVYRKRGSNKLRFIVLRDSTGIIQLVVINSSVEDRVWDTAEKLGIEASIIARGALRKEEKAPTGVELNVEDITLVGSSENWPITKSHIKSREFLDDHRHLWLRSRKMSSIMKVRSTVFRAIREFFNRDNYEEMPPPIFSPNACEGGATLFEVKYFDKKVYLTQSWQLYGEAAIFALEKLYCISPCFRAERSKTSRHLAEFWMAEVETAWMRFDGLLKQAEELVLFIVKEVLRKNTKELEILGRDISKLRKVDAPFKKITYSEALKILKEKDGVEVHWGKDLRTVEEDLLTRHFDKPVIVTNYPKEIMAFYKPRDPENPDTALCFDMLAPEGYGEIIGGSERDTDIEELKKGLEREGENPANYEWYLDTRRYGSVPHSGFGLGVERVVAWLCGLDTIRDAIPFPRTMRRWRP